MRKFILAAVAATAMTGAGFAERREITDKMIGERRREADELLLQRIDRVNTDFAQTQGFEARLKDERLDFERRMMDERKAFLDELEKTDRDLRWKAWEDFREAQDETRRGFHERQVEARRQFRELRDEWKSEVSEEVRERQRRKLLTPAKP